MASKIIYTDKEELIDDESIPLKNKVTADDMNEIKEVVNSHADDIETLETEKADRTEIPTDLSELSNENTKFVNETQLANAVNDEKTARQDADSVIVNTIATISVDYGKTIELSLDSSTFILTATLKNKNGAVLSSSNIDLPIESMIVNGRYDSASKTIILTLQNGNTIEIPVGDLISGLQSEITPQNKLSSDLVDDTNHTNKFVTQAEKNQIETNKNNITSLDENKENISNKVTELTSESTDTQYPSAKVVFDNESALKEKLDRYKNTIETELGDNTDTGTDLTLNGTAEYDVDLGLSGNTSQEQYEGYNLVPNNLTNQTINGVDFVISSDKTITVNGTATDTIAINILTNTSGEADEITFPAGTYTLQGCPAGGSNTSYKLDIINNGTNVIADYGNDTSSKTFNEDLVFDRVRIVVQSGITINNLTFKPMLVSGNTQKSYEKYVGGQPAPNPSYPQTVQVVKGNNELKIANSDNTQSQTYPITLPIGMEMCKIGDYADEFVEQNNTWYKNEKIGKSILDGSNDESWYYDSASSMPFRLTKSDFPIFVENQSIAPKIFSNQYVSVPWNQINSVYSDSKYLVSTPNNASNLRFRNRDCNTFTEFKETLASKPMTLYYPLAEPILEEITDTTLITQLNNIKQAYTYQGQSNISQTNEDLPFIIKADFKLSNLSRIEALESTLETVSSRVDLLEE